MTATFPGGDRVLQESPTPNQPTNTPLQPTPNPTRSGVNSAPPEVAVAPGGTYTVQPGDGLIAITKGLGLGRSAAAQKRVTALNAWQGETPHPGVTWYGGPA